MMAPLYNVVVLGSSLPSSTEKSVVKVGPPLTKLSGSTHFCCVFATVRFSGDDRGPISNTCNGKREKG